MSFYQPKSETIGRFISNIVDRSSTIVIPDLQRPYIWSPKQVIRLIDSIFREWPFGTLLTWEVSVGTDRSSYIPFRGFWEVEDRTENGDSKPASISSQGVQYTMVLDGQQRLQSLLLAVGGDSWGFRLTDNQWMEYLLDNSELNTGKGWSKASLCIDVEKLLDQFTKCDQNISRIAVDKILIWAVTDHSDGYNNRNKEIKALVQ
jgi:hypothetical protein